MTALHILNNTVAKGFKQMAPHARTITVALDMSKAFDTINIHTLIRKLLQTMIPDTIIKLSLSTHSHDPCLWGGGLPPARGGTAHLANWSQLIHPGPSSSRSRFFMESGQSYASTLTHYSTTETLTTAPDYNPLLMLLSLAGDVHSTPGPPRYNCSVCFKTSLAKVQATCVQDTRIGYIQDVLVFETLRIIVEPMAGSIPPVGRHHTA